MRRLLMLALACFMTVAAKAGEPQPIVPFHLAYRAGLFYAVPDTPHNWHQVLLSAFDSANNALKINASPTPPGTTPTPHDGDQVLLSVYDSGFLNVNCVDGCGGSAEELHVNAGSAVTAPNFGGTPSAGTGLTNVTWQQSGSNISAEVPSAALLAPTGDQTITGGHALILSNTGSTLTLNGKLKFDSFDFSTPDGQDQDFAHLVGIGTNTAGAPVPVWIGESTGLSSYCAGASEWCGYATHNIYENSTNGLALSVYQQGGEYPASNGVGTHVGAIAAEVEDQTTATKTITAAVNATATLTGVGHLGTLSAYEGFVQRVAGTVDLGAVFSTTNNVCQGIFTSCVSFYAAPMSGSTGAGFQSDVPSSEGYAFLANGTAPSAFKGAVNLGSAAQTVFNASGVPTKLSGNALAGNGLPSILYSSDLAGQTSAVGDTAMVTPGANTFYRFTAQVNCDTTGAAATVAINLKWTDSGNQAHTQTSTAAVCTTLGASSFIPVVTAILAKSGVAVTWSTTVANSPTYDVDIRLESM